MKLLLRSHIYVSAIGVLMICASCTNLQKVQTKYTPPEKIENINPDTPYLQAHMANGDLYVLKEWEIKKSDSLLTGEGKYYNAERNLLNEGAFQIALNDVQLFESNSTNLSFGMGAILVISGISAAVTVFCLSNTKACFGSCPTFYAQGKNGEALMAEGFSSSILPSLEKTDIDALSQVKPPDEEFNMRLTNEALETHNIKFADLLAVPVRDGKVFATKEGKFYRSGEILKPNSLISEQQDVTDKVTSFDGTYYFSKSDSTNLAKKEKLYANFEIESLKDEEWGLVIGARQTLMSTFLFYQTLSYMGNSAGYILAELERNSSQVAKNVKSIGRELGPIEVQIKNKKGRWETAGVYNETGPLATDSKVIPLPKISDPNIRLILTKGHWRIDYLALARLDDLTVPQRIKPDVYKEGSLAKTTTKKLNDYQTYLTTLPGDEYTLRYKLPEGHKSYDLFLESRGFYLEWIRKEWMKEKNYDKALKMFTRPKKMLKELAPVYKDMEPEMEKIFWESKYAKSE